MKKYLFIALAMLCQTMRAQEVAPPTIYFNTGKTITAEKIRLRRDAFNQVYLLADGKRIQSTQVKFFQNDRGFFANTQHLNSLSASSFAERIDNGRLNLFREMPRRYELESQHYGYHQEGESVYNEVLYYNKGFDNLKKATYANLVMDLNDNLQSMDFLTAYRKKRSTANIFFGVAGATFLTSLITFMSGRVHHRSDNVFAVQPSQNKPYLSYGLMGVGSVFGLVGALEYVKSRDELLNAIDAYNR